MDESIAGMLLGFAGFSAIAGLTWFFSSRKKLFFRVFVPRHEWKNALNTIPDGKDFHQGMRGIALLQFLVGLVFLLISLGVWFIKH